MLKRSNSLNGIPPAKRSRMPAGFHVARFAPVSLRPSTTTSTSRTLFVMVNQPDKQCGIFEVQNRVLTSTTSTQGSSTSPSQKSHVQLPVEPNTGTEFQDIPQNQDEPIQQQTVKPKRKRNMTNAVCYSTYCPNFCVTSNLNSCWQHQLTEWIQFRSAFLDEVLRHDGLGDFFGQTKCSNCGNVLGIIKCRDCSNGSFTVKPEGW